jgi:hypothetical protein
MQDGVMQTFVYNVVLKSDITQAPKARVSRSLQKHGFLAARRGGLSWILKYYFKRYFKIGHIFTWTYCRANAEEEA